MCPARRPMGLQGSGFLLLDYNNRSTHYINVALERDCLCVSVWVRAHVCVSVNCQISNACSGVFSRLMNKYYFDF